jgi:RNA:NAD 2'-phosphotransferase (TPT1/KptA family)
MQTIVELPEFLKRSSSLLKEEEKANLSKSERNDLAKFTSLLLKHYGGTHG